MATHSSILAWRIPWTEEPGRLQSLGLRESDMTEQLSTHSHSLSGNHLPAHRPLQKPRPDSKQLKLGSVLKPELRLFVVASYAVYSVTGYLFCQH